MRQVGGRRRLEGPFAARAPLRYAPPAHPRESPHVPQAEARARAQHLRVRNRAAGEGDGLPRVRRALAVRAGDQPAWASRRWAWASAPDPRAWACEPEIVVGHDFRSYSLSIKQALSIGLMAAGCEVLRHRPGALADGLFRPVRPRRALRGHGHRQPQRERLDRREDGRPAAADLRPRRDGPAEGDRARAASSSRRAAARYALRRRTSPSATSPTSPTAPKLTRPLKVVAACGNGTAGAFAPEALEAMGVRGDPDGLRARLHLPQLQPQPRRPRDAARHGARRCSEHGADVALGFDGDGDRCGVVDDEGEEIFADKIGLMLARDLSALHRTRPSSST